jgi:competence protein ComEA
MKHLVLLFAVVFAFASVASAQTDGKSATKTKAKTEVKQKTAAKEVVKKPAAKTPSTVESLPAGAVLDLNSAPKTDLIKLAGIGEAYAEKIIKGRPYARKDELVSKKIITKKMYDAIKESIVASKAK